MEWISTGFVWLRIRTSFEGNQTAEHLVRLDVNVHL
jgi:hypothetical protein